MHMRTPPRADDTLANPEIESTTTSNDDVMPDDRAGEDPAVEQDGTTFAATSLDRNDGDERRLRRLFRRGGAPT